MNHKHSMELNWKGFGDLYRTDPNYIKKKTPNSQIFNKLKLKLLKQNDSYYIPFFLFGMLSIFTELFVQELLLKIGLVLVFLICRFPNTLNIQYPHLFL